jgi:cellulose synthase/poly-beta-1,6-N-acetylglucosamine synthase-like glycosyltransferase
MMYAIAVAIGVLIAVLGPGYLVWLHRASAREPEDVRTPASFPSIAVIVPLYNEIAWVADKIHNLVALDYPRELLEIWIVDGGSTDGTVQACARAIGEDERFELLRTPYADKTAQLNAALEAIRSEWVLVTDADARLPHDTLAILAQVAERDPGLAVIGTSVTPARAHPLEQWHWRIANRLRQIESRRGSASIVTGPCYLFRRTVLERFPADVVADDVHIALTAAVAGQRVAIADASVIELRAPLRLGDLFRHKLRKANAYLREVHRFFPRRTSMGTPARQVFGWRAAQLVILPILTLAGAVTALGMVTATGYPGVWLIGALTAAGLGVGSMRWRLLGRFGLTIALGILLAGTLLVAMAAYPFWRQTACHPKVGALGCAPTEPLA